ncbi:TRAP transporter permease [Chloroflexota bacterium]
MSQQTQPEAKASSSQPEISSKKQRELTGLTRKFAIAFGALAAIYHIAYILGIFVDLDITILNLSHRAGTAMTITVLVFLLRPVNPGIDINKIPWYDMLFILGAVVSFGYAWIFGEDLIMVRETGAAGLREVIFCFIGVAVLLEAGRRVMGSVYPAIVLAFVIYAYFSNYFPGFLHARGYGFFRQTYVLYTGVDGIFGIPLAVAGTIVVAFVLFAAFLHGSGAGDWFIRLAFALVGHVRGGPAKAAVVASSIFGTFSGSPSANVAGTGVITIPLMKKVGYTSEFSGGVEAAASTGGQIMPPIMGSVAFIISEWLEIPYITIAIAAIVPAFLYYLALFTQVDLEAVRNNLKGSPREELPRFWPVLWEGWYYLLPIIAIVVFLAVFHLPPENAGVYSIGIIFLLSFVKKKDRMGPKKIISSLNQGMISTIPPAIACALAGILIGAITLPGIGYKLSGALVDLSGGSLPILLALVGIACLVLAMGLSTVALYIVVAVLIAPALVSMGVAPLAAHLAVFYFALLSFIIPPVAVAAYTASGIANSNPMKTAVHAMKLGIIAAIVPVAFVYDNGLLLMGSAGQITAALISASIGTVAIAFSTAGYAFTRSNWEQRTLWAIGGIAMLFPGYLMDLGGFALVTLATAWHLLDYRKIKAIPHQEV